MSADRIPFAKLGVPLQMEDKLSPDSPRNVRFAIARGVAPLPAGALLGALYVLAADPDMEVAQAARKSLCELPTRQVLAAIGMNTHPKVLEFLVEFREPDPEIDDRIGMMRAANDRTVVTIAQRAGADLCDKLTQNHERLLLTPGVFVALHGNAACTDAVLQRADAFLRMQKALPEVPAERLFRDAAHAAIPKPARAPPPQAPSAMDLEAEIEAALSGKQSPALLKAQSGDFQMFDLDHMAVDASLNDDDGEFSFDFQDDEEEFSWLLTADRDSVGDERSDERRSIEKLVGEMTVGQRIKLAYLGNKEVRGLLIRDSNKIVSGAVVKSGRLSDQEVANFAGNKNLAAEVLREIAMNGEWTRKYPVKVALVNNPKCPVSMAVGIVATLQKKDLLSLTRNRNVSSVIAQAANRLYRQKFR